MTPNDLALFGSPGAVLTRSFEKLRLQVYLDSMRVPTIGWGHAFFGNTAPPVGTAYSIDQCQVLFLEDYRSALKDFDDLVAGGQLPTGLDPVRKDALVDMLFNLGRKKFLAFNRMRHELNTGDFPEAAAEAKDSAWYKQTTRRAPVIVAMIKTGKRN